MVQNRAFLDLASQFGFGRNKNRTNSKLDSSGKINLSSKSDIIDDADKSDRSDRSSNKTSESATATTIGKTDSDSGKAPDDSSNFNHVVLELLHLQEEIGKLQMKQRQHELSEKCLGLTTPSSISWLLDDLVKVSDNLSYIVDNSAKIQLKLANPAISNSLPIHSSLHQPLVHLTELLSDIGAISERSGKASSWLNGQDWGEVTQHLTTSKHNTEKVVARLKTSASKIQLFRESINIPN